LKWTIFSISIKNISFTTVPSNVDQLQLHDAPLGHFFTPFVWLTNTRNEISSLQQALRYNLDEGLYALYTKIGGRTFVRERTNWSTFTDRYEGGMKVFNFTTNQGVINYR
jgi:hypothetical protein